MEGAQLPGHQREQGIPSREWGSKRKDFLSSAKKEKVLPDLDAAVQNLYPKEKRSARMFRERRGGKETQELPKHERNKSGTSGSKAK